jgi:hypothetical protein
MRTIATHLAAALLAAVAFTAPVRAGAPTVTGGADSKEALVRQFLDALEHDDAAALRALRVDREEYLTIILPGTVPPGQPLRKWRSEATQYFWGEIDSKCLYTEEALLATWRGHHWTVKEMTFDKGQQDYATYRAWKQTRLVLAGEDGKEARLETGSIAEIGGRYKFLSYKRD